MLMNKKKLIRIIIPLFIVIVIAGIWIYKNINSDTADSKNNEVFINSDGTPYVPSEDIEAEFTMYSYKDTKKHAFTVHQSGLTEDQMLAILADMGVTE